MAINLVSLLRAGCTHMRNDASGQPGKALLERLRFPDCQRS
jgi:hypothetical protein